MAPVLTFLFFLPSLGNNFVNFDDTEHILANTPIHFWSFPSFLWMATAFHTGNWMPLTWLSLSLDWKLGSGSPLAFHLTNLLLHCANTALVFALARRVIVLSRPSSNGLLGALITALLFGLHPLHVESVAWASERKDVLCALFFLLSSRAYLDHARKPQPNWKGILPSLGFFASALMSKSMAVTLPAVLLILDAWPLRRFSTSPRRALLEKVPFFLLSAAVSWVTILAQSQAGAAVSLEKFPLSFRLANAFHSIAFYLSKMLLPLGLSALYPLERGERAFTPANLLALMVVLALTGVVLVLRKKNPALLAAWGYFLVTLLPVLGLFQVGSQAAADRYTYLPSLGPFLLLGASLAFLLKDDVARGWRPALLLGGLLGLATLWQAGTWKDSISLWENVVRKHPGISSVAYADLGDAYREKDRLPEALQCFDRAVELSPEDAMSRSGRAIVHFMLGHWPQAEEDWRTAIALDPRYLTAHQNFWIGLQRVGKYEESLGEANRVAGLNPGSALSWDLVAISSAQLGRFKEALEANEKSLALEPGNPEWLRHRSAIQSRMADPKQDLKVFQRAIEGS